MKKFSVFLVLAAGVALGYFAGSFARTSIVVSQPTQEEQALKATLDYLDWCLNDTQKDIDETNRLLDTLDR